MTSLTPSFQIKFGHAILPGQVTVGKFDGIHASLAAATTGGRVLLHTPHDILGADNPLNATTKPAFAAPSVGSVASTHVRFLNINRDITALASGPIKPSHPTQDVLLVGTSNSLQAYDVMENKDVFFREVPDTVTAATIGAWTVGGQRVAIAGGNCSVQGFDASGKDAYWTVTGDIVNAIAFGDLDGDGAIEMLVGSADFDIRSYRGEDLLSEMTETDKITALAIPLPGQFAYALANGTVGVYSGASSTRLWRVKSKMRAVALVAFDINNDGVPELIAGFANGRFEARRIANGELLYRDTLSGPIASLQVADYRGDGKPLLLVVGVDGEVRGYSQSDPDTLAAILLSAGAPAALATTTSSAAPEGRGALPGSGAGGGATAIGAMSTDVSGRKLTAPQAAVTVGTEGAPDLQQLLAERARLDGELRTLEGSTGTTGKGAGSGTRTSTAASNASSLPATTDITISLDFNPAAKRIELVVTATAMGVAVGGAEPTLRAAVVYALDAGIFGAERESCVVVPSTTASGSAATPATGSASLRIPLQPPTNVSTELRVQAIVGAHHSSAHYGVIEKAYRLPKFAMFQLLATSPALAASTPSPRGSVVFSVKERASRVATWIAKVFPVRMEQIVVNTSGGSPCMEARFLNLRSGTGLSILVEHEHGGHVTIACEGMELAGELLQDLCGYLGVSDADSSADFPDEFAAFRKTLHRMEECTAIRNKMTGDSAVASGTVKALVIQAEDARILADMRAMTQYYGELSAVHGELLGEYSKRAANHTTLVTTLKDVNQMIQRAANLRVGDAKSRVIAACRGCIKNNTPFGMLAIMASGKAQ